MKPLVEEHGGVVEKFIGDAVVAVFGFEGELEEGALEACRSALAMRERLAELNRELERTRGVVLRTRTGITTGEVAGRGGAEARSLVGGETQNTASSLESAAEPDRSCSGSPPTSSSGKPSVRRRREWRRSRART
jgi:class 3 adenylate cyclase